MMNLIERFKRIFREKVFPYTAWLPRYYILFKWADIPQEAVVLDLGCGEGYVTLRLAEKCKQVVGLDISNKSLLLANEKKSHSRFKQRIDFVLGNIVKLPFPDDSFDLIVFQDVLVEIEQDQVALKEITRVLKPGGRVVITVAWQYTCEGSLFKEQRTLKKLIPNFLYSVYLLPNVKWLKANDEIIRKCWHIYRNYTVEELKEKASTFLTMTRYGYFLKKYSALATDISYGIKGLYLWRSLFFWPAVRMDYYFRKNEPGYSIIAEFTKEKT